MAQSKELTEFYRWWLKESQKENPCPRIKQSGLCMNLIEFMLDLDLSYTSILQEMKTQFLEKGLCKSYPFNSSDNCYSYFSEVLNESFHLNQDRIQWVKDHCEGVE